MKVSLNFVKDYVSFPKIDEKVLAEKMLLIGNEYNEVKKLCAATNLVIGYVKEQTKHPEADKLKVCLVDINEEEDLTIVCGASNVDKGQKVIVAKVGAKLPNNIEIKKATIRGIESKGMICSLEELGIETKYIPERSKGGIHILEDEAPIGEDALEYLHYNDIIIDFDFTSNRSDLLSIIGVAYEMGALFSKPVTLPEIKFKYSNKKASDYLEVLGKTEKAPLYLTRIVEDVVIKESPNFIKSRLISSGIRPINNVVDISNYVMLEYGQPLHFFDYEKLGKKIIIRQAEKGEKLLTLDNQERTLKESDIVITTPKEIVALAGVMGGYNTEITNETKTIVIESAIFDPRSIRKTSREVLKSEASRRFEKGINPEWTKQALERAAYLLEKYAQGKVLKEVVGYNKIQVEEKEVEITLTKINNVLGLNLSIVTVKEILKRLLFPFRLTNETFKITIPSRRLDISIQEDIIEEIGRFYGYEHIQEVLPLGKLKEGRYTKEDQKIKGLKTKLNSFGLKEIITYSLIKEDYLKEFKKEDLKKVSLLSPMSEERKHLRLSLIPSLLEVINYNKAHFIDDIFLYEIGSIYYQEEDCYIEETKLSIGGVGKYLFNRWQKETIEFDFYLLKSFLENILSYLGLFNRYQLKSGTTIKEMHPNKSAEIFVDNEYIGFIGALHPTKSKYPIYLLEISLKKILKKKVRPIKYKPLSIYPKVNKDLAFIVDKKILVGDLIETIKQAGGKLLSDIEVFDLYENIGENSKKKSLAFSLTFLDQTKTLTDLTVNELLKKIIDKVETKFQAQLLDQ